MKNRRLKSLIIIVLGITLMASCVTVSFASGSGRKTKKMTVYQDVLKSGKYVYCTTEKGIYKVNLKTNKVKRIVSIYCPFGLKLYKGYLYFMMGETGPFNLYRIKTNGKKLNKLGDVTAYAISKGTIYYTTLDFIVETDKEITRHKQMNLNGKNKKDSKYNVSFKSKSSNAKGYRNYTKTKQNKDGKFTKFTEYLVKPNKKKIKLCSYPAY